MVNYFLVIIFMVFLSPLAAESGPTHTTQMPGKNNLDEPNAGSTETPESRLHEALLEYRKAKEKGDEASTAGWGVALGKAYQAAGKNLEAVNVLEKSCSFFKKNMDLKQEAMTLNLLGTLYRYIGSLNKSLSYHTQALKIFENLKDSSLQAATYNKLGIVFRNLNDLEQARAQYISGLKIATDGDLLTKAALNNSLGSLSWYQENWEEAEKYYKKALKIHEQQHSESGAYAGVLNNLGNTMRSQEKFDQALNYYDRALQFCESQRRIHLRAVILKNIGLTYLKQKQYEAAQRYIRQSLNIAIKSQLQRIILEDYRAQSNLYSQTGQFEQAYFALEKFLLEYRKKVKLQSANDLVNLHSIHELEMGFKEIELIKANRVKERMYYILIFLVLISVAGLAWFSLYRLKVRSRREVRTKDKELHLRELQINKLGHDFEDIQDRYRRIFEGAPDAIVIADHQTGEIVQANPQAERLLLAEKGELNGVSLYQILSYDVLAQINAQRIEDVNPLCRGMETTLTDFEGQNIPIEVSIQELFFGERRFLQVIIRDLREKRQLEQQLLQSQKMEAIGNLAGGIAHDFNNLLTVIRGYCELIIIKARKQSSPVTQIQEIDKAAERAQVLTQKLLAFSRKQIQKEKVLNLNQLITNMMKLITRLLGTSIKIKTSLDENLHTVKADPGQIEQVIMNLTINSKDSMGHSGTLIFVTTNRSLTDELIAPGLSISGEYVVVSVSDTGHGMDETTQKKIFEPFFTTKPVNKGTGLGLSMVYGIIKQHKGYIRVRSQLGEGTTFDLFFPALSTEDSSVETSEGQKTEESLNDTLGGSETILLVEDENRIRTMVSNFLEEKGYHVIEAQSGEDGLTKFNMNHHQIDLVLTDIVMFGMSGLDMVEQFNDSFPRSRIIFMTGYSEQAMELDSNETKDYTFIDKPFKLNSLIEIIRTKLDEEL